MKELLLVGTLVAVEDARIHELVLPAQAFLPAC